MCQFSADSPSKQKNKSSSEKSPPPKEKEIHSSPPKPETSSSTTNAIQKLSLLESSVKSSKSSQKKASKKTDKALALLTHQIKKLKKHKREEVSSDDEDSSDDSDSSTLEDSQSSGNDDDQALEAMLPIAPLVALGAQKRKKSKAKKKYPYLPRPHTYVTRLPKPGSRDKLKKNIAFENLTMAEYTYGYLKAYQECENTLLKQTFMDHFTAVMKDAASHPWDRIITYEVELYEELRRGNISWRDQLQIESIRLKHLFGPNIRNPSHVNSFPRHNITTQAHATSNSRPTPSPPEPAEKYSKEGKFPCQPFQTGTCSVGGKGRHHDKFVHFCKFCFFAPHRQLACNHAESNCNQKPKSQH